MCVFDLPCMSISSHRSLVSFLLRYRTTLVITSTHSTLHQLIHTCHTILITRAQHKDAITQAALVLVLIWLGCACEEEVAITIQHVLQRHVITPELQSRVCVMQWVYETCTTDAIWYDTLPVLSQLALLRAIVTYASVHVLVEIPISATTTPAATTVSTTSATTPNTTLLCDLLFPLIMSACDDTSPLHRHYAIQALELWLIRTSDLLSSHTNITHIHPRIDTLLPTLLPLIAHNREHPFRAITGMMKNIFESYLRLETVRGMCTWEWLCRELVGEVEREKRTQMRGIVAELWSLLP